MARRIGVGDDRPGLGRGAEPVVERDLVEDDPLGMVQRVEELVRRERRAVAGEVAHRGGTGVERAGVDARGEQAEQQLRAAAQLLRIERRAEAGDLRDDVGGERVLTFADQRSGPAPNVACLKSGIVHRVEVF